ncbi:hypothetical protein KUTeg_004590 [Tegillarca granosa]|uniref:Uncharacterized protein n=1 Tax=Tegillarca granosa TaxID=220873 RepID=A0ABQ9FQB8_TEGGR|nr:hypothetical protein KUTeg_004590 [Tegillarca granosa]
MTINTNHKKRPRSPQNDCEECLPISKRINRLQIQPGRQMNFDGTNQVEVPFQRSTSLQEDLNVQCRNMRLHSDPLLPNSPVDLSQNHCTVNQYGPSHSSHASSSTSSNSVHCNNCHTADGNPLFLQYEDEKIYDPELNQSDNPHYFNINKLLFEAHVDRVGRIRTKYDEDS